MKLPKGGLLLDLPDGGENENPIETLEFAKQSEKKIDAFCIFECFGIGSYDVVCRSANRLYVWQR